MFSAMWLSNTTPRASNQHQQGSATQAQTPAQSQAPDTIQNNGPSTVAAERFPEEAEAGTSEHQDVDPEAAQEKEEISAPTIDQSKLTAAH